MKTKLTSNPETAANVLITGSVAAFPTETVYGLGANAFDADAVADIFRAKGRPSDNPLIVHLHSLDQLREVARRVPVIAQNLIERFFPGPLTVILPRHANVPDIVTGGRETVGVRMPSHPMARAFLRACGFPVAAPSANRSGRPSPTSWQAVASDLEGRIPCILKGGRTPVGLESTVVDCTGRVPVVLRAGAISLAQLRRVIASARSATERERGRGKSPGLKYRHYAPRARVVLVSKASLARIGRGRLAYIGVKAPPGGPRWQLTRVCGSVRVYAQELFHFFRTCDRAGVRLVYCQPVSERGLGLALMDRIRRASATAGAGRTRAG